MDNKQGFNKNFGEFILNYDNSSEQSILKLVIAASTRKNQGKTNSKKINLDIICNEFEYEILYKKAYVNDQQVEEQNP